MTDNEDHKRELKKIIVQLLSQIDTLMIEWDPKDSQNLHELRKRIFFVHAMADRQISLLTLDHLFRTIFPKSQLNVKNLKEEDFVKWADLMGGFVEAMDEMRFKQKLVFAKKLGVLEQEDFSLLDNFNTLRNRLGHPKVTDKEEDGYNDDNKYINALKLINDVAKFCGNFGFPWFNELDDKLNADVPKKEKNETLADEKVPF